MSRNIAQSLSLWIASTEAPLFTPLRTDIAADTCVIGAGMAGMCTAYLLAKEGRRVAVVTQEGIGHGETMRTTAHLSNVLDTRYYRLEQLHGEQGARLAAESHATAIDRIEEIARHEQIDCDFQRLDAYLCPSPGQSFEMLDRERDAASRAGIEVQRVARSPVASFCAGPCLRFPRQAQFHPLKFLDGLATAIERLGGMIYTETNVEHVVDGTPTHVTASGGPTVNARTAVVATDSPVSNIVALHTKQAAYRTYVVAARTPVDSVLPALYWDTLNPYHYVRLHSAASEEGEAEQLLIVGGEDHKTGHTENPEVRYELLEAWMRENFPLAGEVEYRWSGQILEPNDGLAFIGRNPRDDNVYVATGTSGNGITYGMISGILIADLIVGRKNAWGDLYDPSRITLRAAKEYLRENLDVAARYGELLTPGEVASEEQVPAGSGAVMRRGLSKVAVYRDENGKLYRLSAACKHLGCIVHWNSAEKSWDCPCHGSRYNRFGKVINGPAIKDLSTIDEGP